MGRIIELENDDAEDLSIEKGAEVAQELITEGAVDNDKYPRCCF